MIVQADPRARLLDELYRRQARLREREAVEERGHAGGNSVMAGQNDYDADAILATQANELTIRTRAILLDEVTAIRRALSRVDDGTYGSCVRCGGAIAPKRLEIIPWAAACVACAARRERRH